MQQSDNQIDYWNRMGPGKSFGHPVNLERLTDLLPKNSCVLDFGCGYGRVLGLLHQYGYSNLIGVDPAPAMVLAFPKHIRKPCAGPASFLEGPQLPLRRFAKGICAESRCLDRSASGSVWQLGLT